MEKIIITSPNAPLPLGPYSHGNMVKAGNLLFVSGQVGIDPATNKLVYGNVEKETLQVMINLKAILSEAGMDLKNVVKATVFLKDMDDFASMNKIYNSFFGNNYPARETVQVVRLPIDASVEISVIAAN